MRNRLEIKNMTRDQLIKYIIGNSERYSNANMLMLETFGDSDLVAVATLVKNEVRQNVSDSLINFG